MQLGWLPAAPALVTVVAIDAVVDISANPTVPGIGLCLGVAVCTLENRIVGWVGMARRTHPVGAAMVHREKGVVESCIQPTRRGVTRPTSSRESRGNMVGIGRALVVHLVTRITIGGSVGEIVI